MKLTVKTPKPTSLSIELHLYNRREIKTLFDLSCWGKDIARILQKDYDNEIDMEQIELIFARIHAALTTEVVKQ